MTIELKFAIVVTGAMTALLILGMSVAAVPVPVTAQGSLGSGGDPTSFLESAMLSRRPYITIIISVVIM
jgi:hypothetical protein